MKITNTNDKISRLHAKINTYVGFAVKSRKIVYGADNIEKSRRIKLIMLSSELSPRTEKKMKKLECNIISHYDFNNLSLGQSYKAIKAIAITDESLAQAILKNHKIIKERSYNDAN